MSVMSLADDTSKLVRQEAFDSILEAGRESTPVAASQQRDVARMTIAEMYDQGFPTFKEKYHRSPVDDRGAVIRASA